MANGKRIITAKAALKVEIVNCQVELRSKDATQTGANSHGSTLAMSDSESDNGHAPNQALPVANLPFSFNGVPQDGLEYLFTVRSIPYSH